MGSSPTTTTQQDQKKDPWAPTQPYLQDLLSQTGQQFGNTGVTPNEQSAIAGLTANAQAGNPFAPGINSAAQNMLTGGPDRSGYLTNGYGTMTDQLSPFASGQFVNPQSNPALQGYLDVARGDATKNINSMFAGAGRDLSGQHVQALGRGITQAEAPILAGSYENERGRQMSAIQQMFQGAGSTAAGLSGLDQSGRDAQLKGIAASTMALDANNQPYNALLQASQMGRQLPLQNISSLENMILPIANAGGTATGSSTSTTNNPFNPLSLLPLAFLWGGGK